VADWFPWQPDKAITSATESAATEKSFPDLNTDLIEAGKTAFE
jgi:hypothetical protein